MKKQAESVRCEIKQQDDFNLMRLFKSVAFEDQREAAKQIYTEDVVRFFRLNNRLIDPQRIIKTLYGRIIGQGNQFDYGALHKLLTRENRAAVVHNPSVLVPGFKNEDRRFKAHKSNFNKKHLASLTTTNKAAAEQRRRRENSRGALSHSRGRSEEEMDRSCRLNLSIAHTKCFKTDCVAPEEARTLQNAFSYNQVVLEDELEDCRIRLTSHRDFYPRLVFERYLALEESAEFGGETSAFDDTVRQSVSEGQRRASAESIYQFIVKNRGASDLGMPSFADF